MAFIWAEALIHKTKTRSKDVLFYIGLGVWGVYGRILGVLGALVFFRAKKQPAH